MAANTSAPSTAAAAEGRDTMIALAILWLIPALAFLAALMMVG
ncbi:hypothetical protein [Nocardioides sp. IC4_145]|nr:hypothetical protein [Nocardioides sp. IC4_145]